MVQINDSHKEHKPSKGKKTFEWLDENGCMKDINVMELTDDELWALRNSMKNWYNEQMKVLDDEIDRWETIYCCICGQEDLAFRGTPFITWGMRAGQPMCPQHVAKFDRIGTPEGEQWEKDKKELQLKELFG